MFYVYEHWRPDLNLPFYVGKGLDTRVKLLKRRHNKHHTNIRNKLIKAGMDIEIKIIAQTENEDEAFDIERMVILDLTNAGIPLVNLTSGGDGISGFTHTESTKQKMSASATGKSKSPEHIARMKLSKKYSEYPNSFKEKCRKRMTGAGNPMYGKPSNMRGKSNIGVSWFQSCVRHQHYWGC